MAKKISKIKSRKNSTVKRSKKISRKRNPNSIDPEEIELNFEIIYRMANNLNGWNTKYDSFPDLKEWIDRNYTLGNKEEKKTIYDYLSSLAAKRDASYWGIQPWSTQGKGIKDRHEEFRKNFLNLLKTYKFNTNYYYWP